MKSIFFILLIIFIMPSLTPGQTLAKKSLKYLGQNSPGMVPIKFAPGLVSLADQNEFGSVFSRDGKEFYYAVDSAGKAEIRYMKLMDNEWTKPVKLIFHETYSYNDPFLSPNQSKLFFISDMPANGSGKKDYDIWYVERNGDNNWSKPVNAGSEINSDNNEYYVSFSNNGTMYFSSNRKTGEGSQDGYDIYASSAKSGKFQTAINLGASVNTQYYEADVFVAPDESYLIFCAERPDGYGKGDLYVSFKNSNGTWSKAKNMGAKINSEGHQLCPFVSADRKYLFYTSNQDIYWVDARVIDELR